MLYRLDASASEVAAQFGAAAGSDPWRGGHIAPGSFALVLTAGREAIAGPGRAEQPLRMVPRLWGVPPPGMPVDPRNGVLSVRNVKSPFWIGNLRNSEFRCLVPATAFMERGREGSGDRQAPRALAELRRPAAVRLRRGVEGQRGAKLRAADLRAQRAAARDWLLRDAGDPARR